MEQENRSNGKDCIDSQDWQARADKVLSQGCLTYSKRNDQFIEGVYPTHAICNEDGKLVTTNPPGLYIDWVCSLGANPYGDNNTYSLPSINEVICAELLIKKLDLGPRKLKFLKSGSEACSAALRFARAYTGRSEVCGIGYHGYLNEFISAELPGLGTVPQSYLKSDSIEQLIKAVNKKTAAVILEPLELDNTQERMESVRALRKKCKELKVLFIADEVVSGFRVPAFTVSRWWDLDPDIICLGKAMSGSSISAVVGRPEIMDINGVFISTTFAGESFQLENAIKVMNRTDRQYLQKMWNRADLFRQKINTIDSRIQLKGYATRGTWIGTPKDVAIFWQEMLKRGHFLGRAWFYGQRHTSEDRDKFLKDMEIVTNHLDEYKLEGLLPRPIFKRFEQEEDKKNG